MASNQTDPLQIALDFEQQLVIPFENKSLLVRSLTHRSKQALDAVSSITDQRFEWREQESSRRGQWDTRILLFSASRRFEMKGGDLTEFDDVARPCVGGAPEAA